MLFPSVEYHGNYNVKDSQALSTNPRGHQGQGDVLGRTPAGDWSGVPACGLGHHCAASGKSPGPATCCSPALAEHFFTFQDRCKTEVFLLIVTLAVVSRTLGYLQDFFLKTSAPELSDSVKICLQIKTIFVDLCRDASSGQCWQQAKCCHWAAGALN